ncbi:MAG: hypothetical protein KDB79_00095 [Acidobacteria bacterium]|nr:hypothetical protein [Acidobacteriota bacterium]
MILLFDNSNLLFGVLPESMAILFFGISLITGAIAMRWVLTKVENNGFDEKEAIRNLVDRSAPRGDLADAELGLIEK